MIKNFNQAEVDALHYVLMNGIHWLSHPSFDYGRAYCVLGEMVTRGYEYNRNCEKMLGPGYRDLTADRDPNIFLKAAGCLMSAFSWATEENLGRDYWASLHTHLHQMGCCLEPALAPAPKKVNPWAWPKLPMVAANDQPKPVKKRRRTTAPIERVRDILIRRGYREIGSGWFSTVYGKDGSDKVFKLCRCGDKWPLFIQWANDNGWAGSYAPKVLALKVFKDNSYVACIERLDATLCQLFTKGDPKADDMETVREFAADIIKHRQPLITDEALKPDRLNIGVRLQMQKQVIIEEAFPGLLKFANDLSVEFDGGFDLHNQNWMVKGDRLVCTDPLTNSVTTSKRTTDVRIKGTVRLFA